MADKFQLKALIMGVDKLSPALAQVRKNVLGFRKNLMSSGLGKPISIQDIITGGALAAPFVAGAKAAIEYESSLADVRKVVDFDTPEQFAQMSDDILKMSGRLPMAAKDIAAIVASGGQAGLAREELGKFAEDAVKMGIAFDQTADESGTMMAKWRTSFRIGQDEVVALADKVNYLSDNSAATAQQIAGIVTRIGSLGEVAGLATGEIAAIGATLASVGVGEEQAATGMKNFMLAMTAGRAATKTQQGVFKALRLDAKQVSVDMQKDAKGTMMKVLTAISKVDKSKQAGVLQQLFGKESITAIAPMLTNLEQLKNNLALVGDETKFAGSMQKEFETRSKTTANSMQLVINKVVALGITVGNVLLPPFNEFMQFVGPMIDQVTMLAAAHPWLIKGILGAGAAFVVLRIGVLGAVMATRILTAVMSMSPVGLLVRGLALAAGFLIANWSTVGPWFKSLWGDVTAAAGAAFDWLKNVFFTWSPLGIIIENWGQITEWLAGFWADVEGLAGQAMSWIEGLLGWSPLDVVIGAWEPLVGWFRGLWEEISGYISPIMEGASFITDGVGSGVDWIKDKVGLGPSAPVGAPGQQTKLNGELQIKFENAPPGMRVEPMKTDQSGLQVKQNVGYRSMGMAGAG
jgi:TP901 family phage tail tape measure protein